MHTHPLFWGRVGHVHNYAQRRQDVANALYSPRWKRGILLREEERESGKTPWGRVISAETVEGLISSDGGLGKSI